MTTEKIIAVVIALAILGCIYWAMRRKRDRKPPDAPMTKDEYDRRNNGRVP